MGRHLNWYLVELERALADALPAHERAEVLNEVEAHLMDSAEELTAICLHGEDPERMAVERFGSPAQIAFEITGKRPTASYWHGARVPLAWACGTALWMEFSAEPVPLLIGLVFGLIGFGFAVSRSRQMIPGALAAAVAALFGLDAFIAAVVHVNPARTFADSAGEAIGPGFVYGVLYWLVLVAINAAVVKASTKGGLAWHSKVI